MNTKTTTGLSALTIVIAASGWMLAQEPSLTPPGAPADGVFKTLDQVEPRIAVNSVNTPGANGSLFIISQPGSYYLIGDIKPVGSFRAIEITASNVTLDLNGFTIDGIDAPAHAVQGVLSPEISTNVSVVNGSVINWDADGILLGSNSLIQNVRAINNNKASTGCAALCAGSNSIIRDCELLGNKKNGIRRRSSTNLQDTLTVIGCRVTDTVGDGISIYSGIVSDCHVTDCTGIGITVQGGEVRNCVVERATLDGIRGQKAKLIGNHVVACGTGINVFDPPGFVAGNTMTGNTSDFQIQTGIVTGKIFASPKTTGFLIGSGTASGVGPGVGTSDPWANFTY